MAAKNKLIMDIRIFKSDIPNIDGNSSPSGTVSKHLIFNAERLAFKLREHNFSLGDFDHLYVNFTNCLPPNVIQPAQRSIDPYHKWFRYYDVGISNERFEKWEDDEVNFAFYAIEQLLIKYFSTSEQQEQIIKECVKTVLAQGENTLIKYKQKNAKSHTAVIYLKILNNGRFLPILCVYNLKNEQILCKNLPQQALYLDALGEIQLSNKKVTVKPRKNFRTQKLKPICFELNN